jgi:hypothetical protein
MCAKIHHAYKQFAYVIKWIRVHGHWNSRSRVGGPDPAHWHPGGPRPGLSQLVTRNHILVTEVAAGPAGTCQLTAGVRHRERQAVVRLRVRWARVWPPGRPPPGGGCSARAA